jgi:hypothetical protein
MIIGPVKARIRRGADREQASVQRLVRLGLAALVIGETRELIGERSREVALDLRDRRSFVQEAIADEAAVRARSGRDHSEVQILTGELGFERLREPRHARDHARVLRRHRR